jgi:DHA2 family multidrug resistance protein
MSSTAEGAAGGWSPERSAAGGHNPYLIAFVVSIATFMEVLDTTIANVALRYIAGGLAVGIDESTYVITSYLVANAIVLSISGWLATVIGRKRFYMICVGVFAFASLLCGFAWNLESLVLFRILQGLGGGGMATSEQAILADPFRRKNAVRLLPSTASPSWWRPSSVRPSAAGSATIIRGIGCS